MKVYICLFSDGEKPAASTTARTAARNMNVNERTIWKHMKEKGYYEGKNGKVYQLEVQKCNRVGSFT